MRGFLFYLLRPEPEPAGVSVEPLGEALGPRVFPDTLWVLFGEVTVVPAVCTENLNPRIVVMESAEDGERF
jgi:hypothetical protein